MNIIGIVICGYVIGLALFAPGPITLHRVIGPVVLYLTVGIAFAIAFRLVCDLIPEALHGTATGEGEIHLSSSILYFSLVTLMSPDMAISCRSIRSRAASPISNPFSAHIPGDAGRLADGPASRMAVVYDVFARQG